MGPDILDAGLTRSPASPSSSRGLDASRHGHHERLTMLDLFSILLLILAYVALIAFVPR